MGERNERAHRWPGIGLIRTSHWIHFYHPPWIVHPESRSSRVSPDFHESASSEIGSRLGTITFEPVTITLPRFTFDHWSAKRNCETNCQFLIIKNWSREINKNNQEQKNWEYGVCFVEKFFPVIENRVSIILDNRFRSRRIIKKQLQESIIGNFSCQNLEKQKKRKLCVINSWTRWFDRIKSAYSRIGEDEKTVSKTIKLYYLGDSFTSRRRIPGDYYRGSNARGLTWQTINCLRSLEYDNAVTVVNRSKIRVTLGVIEYDPVERENIRRIQ